MELYNIIAEHIGPSGRLVSMNKAAYSKQHPKNKVYFNACIFNSRGEQIWHGDVDFTASYFALKYISDLTAETFYITPEYPFRADFNNVSLKKLKNDDAVVTIVGNLKTPEESIFTRLKKLRGKFFGGFA